MTVDELAHKELELYSSVTSISGTIEEKNEQIKNLGIFDQYKKMGDMEKANIYFEKSKVADEYNDTLME